MMVWVLCGSIWSVELALVLLAAAIKGLTGTWVRRFCPTADFYECLINSR
jgi:hypothetical protein